MTSVVARRVPLTVNIGLISRKATPIDKRKISADQRELILRIEEGHFADVKATDIAPGKLTRTITACANADGGKLYVGIAEDKATSTRTWQGFYSAEAANGHVQAFEPLFPLATTSTTSFSNARGKGDSFFRFRFGRRSTKRASDGQVYLRRGAQNLPVASPAALKQLEYTKGLASFESELVNVDAEAITNSLPAIEFMLRVVPSAEPANWLAKQQLLRQSRPTVAGVLLFADEPQAVLPKRCGIKIYRYRTRDPQGSRETLAFDPLTIEGHAYTQIKEAVARTTAVVEDIRRLGDETLEAVHYPPEALHEIITNSVLHRDYSIADDIHVRVFDNRVEVESPGRLPAHITVKNILDERFARNGNIVRIVNKFPDPPNKDVGEGLNTAFAAMTKLGLKTPIIEERDNSVLVTIRHEPLASPEETILDYLETHETVRNRIARQLTHIGGDYVVKDIFGRLVARGLIEKVPGTDRGSTAYRKGPKFLAWRSESTRGSKE
jgi:ATP-dependent DNA helicase RecG